MHTAESYADDFQSMRERYFLPLCQALSLAQGADERGVAYAVTSAAAGNVRVFFECERGLYGFGVGEVMASTALCDLESLAERFPRVRVLPEGRQRLDLNEQAVFIQTHWEDLQVMFSPKHIRETKAWQDAASAAYTKKFTRDT